MTKLNAVSQTTMIQLTRQGVSSTLRGWFAPCEHGHAWHVEVSEYAARMKQPAYWFAELCNPNCHECYGQKTPRPEWPSEKYATSNNGHARYREDLLAWSNSDHSGQVAWRSDRETKYASVEDAKSAAQQAFTSVVGFPVEFSPTVRAYCYATAHEQTIWPCIADDVYELACTFEPSTNTIRHEPSNVCLIAFDGPTQARFDIDRAAERFAEQTQRAYGEFLAQHNQRMGEYDAKCWLAWLLSEYIKKAHGTTGVKRYKYVSRDGQGRFAGSDQLNSWREDIAPVEAK